MMRQGGDSSGGRGRQPPQRLPVNPRRHKVAPENRKRVATACNACNIRRVKCSGEHPCRPCRSSSRDCVYPTTTAKVSVPRSELDDLRHKVDLLERALRDTVPDDARRHDVLALLARNAGDASAAASSVSSAVAETSPGAQSVPPGQSLSSKPSPGKQHQAPPSHHQQGQHHQQQHQQQQQHPQPEDDQASTEGRLLHDPDGHARFLGETSGATFLDYLKEFMSALLPLAYHNQGPGVDGSTFLSSLGRYQTYDSRPLHERDVDPLWLPERPEMQAMLAELRCFIQDGSGSWPSGGIYWWGDMSSPPGPDPSSPEQQQQPGPASTSGSGSASASATGAGTGTFRPDSYRRLAFYHTAFAVVSQATTTPESPQPSMSEHYFSRARLLLGNPLDITRFTTSDVAALALMGFYLIEMNRRDAAYMCVSNAMHISIMHGAHRGWVDQAGRADERAKRIFWTLYVLDRWLSCLMGRPPTIMDDAIRLQLPCDAPSMPPAAGLKAHVELSRISGYIVCNSYQVSPWERDTRPVKRPEDAIRMLDQWLENLPPILQLSDTELSNDPACCLLHMGYNQLVILTIRPVFFAAVKKTFAERLVSRQSSLQSHPRLGLLRRCIAAAERNVLLARHVLALNHPRKLLQAGLHFIFNAAICLMLRELLFADDDGRDGLGGGLDPRAAQARDHDLDFVIARFDEESRVGSNYGRDCAAVLRDLRVLVSRLRGGGGPTIPISIDHHQQQQQQHHQTPHPADPRGNPMDMGQAAAAAAAAAAWPQKMTAGDMLQQPIHVEHGHALYDELVSWIDDEWQPYGTAYLI